VAHWRAAASPRVAVDKPPAGVADRQPAAAVARSRAAEAAAPRRAGNRRPAAREGVRERQAVLEAVLRMQAYRAATPPTARCRDTCSATKRERRVTSCKFPLLPRLAQTSARPTKARASVPTTATPVHAPSRAQQPVPRSSRAPSACARGRERRDFVTDGVLASRAGGTS
jgi:hypothetical protein